MTQNKHTSTFEDSYYRFFSISELRDNLILQWSLGAVVFAYFLVFYGWSVNSVLTIQALVAGAYTCPPYLQDCGGWYFLEALPYGYSQTIWYMILFATLVGVIYFMSQRDWLWAHIALWPSFLWHSALVFFASDSLGGNYEYYLFTFGLTLLVLPHKEFFLKLYLVVFYVLSTFVKIHPGWVLGTYFSSMQIGLPIFPAWSIPIWTNMVIFFEMVLAWFLMSRNLAIQRPVVFFFILFHLYSGILVVYRYPATVLPLVVILFGWMYRYTPVPLDRKSIAGWLIVLLLFMAQLSSHIIPGDEKLTMEANKYGLYMFEANHQCIYKTEYVKDGVVVDSEEYSAGNARNRCNVYTSWFRYKVACDRNTGSFDSIRWQLDHSVNGGPFLRIVDVENVCEYEYKAFSHNEWIKDYHDNPEIVGYPLENYYR